MSDILLPAQATGPPGTAKAWNTVFGWALRGAFTPDKPGETSPAPVYVATCTAVDAAQDAMVKFWELEEPPKQNIIMTPEENGVQTHYSLTHSYVQQAERFMVFSQQPTCTPPAGQLTLELKAHHSQSRHSNKSLNYLAPSPLPLNHLTLD